MNTKWISLRAFATAIEREWKVAYRLCRSGKVRARSTRVSKTRRKWEVAASEVAHIKRSPPWEASGYRGICPPQRLRRPVPANTRINNPDWKRARSQRATVAALKKRMR